MVSPNKFYIRNFSDQKNLNYLLNFEDFDPSSSLIYEFLIEKCEGGFFICDRSGLMCVVYDCNAKETVNLRLADKDKITDVNSALWLLDENSDGATVIRSYNNPEMVWTSFQSSLPFCRAVLAPFETLNKNQLLLIEVAY
ncbi:hypothetical protein H2241_23395 [Pantoea ananatis]|uniref:hypothetical protein n=1 Tax=Pantoea ananas TaxID=553 RepID=UPI00158DA83F|nr:hypothetical protein [Pantoea ananatis]MBA4823858.1 hypothetical protein [Pantoea ananatis]QKV86022.1 hypothetical protein FOB88_02200 [Pantoea ananatis]